MFEFISVKRLCIKKKTRFGLLQLTFSCTEETGMRTSGCFKRRKFFLLRNIKNSKTSFPCSCHRIQDSRPFFQSMLAEMMHLIFNKDIFSPSCLVISMLIKTILAVPTHPLQVFSPRYLSCYIHVSCPFVHRT